MMKSTLFLLVFLAFGFITRAQNSVSHEEKATNGVEEFIDDYTNDPSASKLISNEFGNIDGSPFVTDDWLLARITIDSSRVYENVPIRLNVYDNKIHFKDAAGKERMLTTKVKEVQITDANSPLNNAIFLSGFAPNKNVFFRVLVDGPKIRLLEKFSARKSDIKVFNGEPKLQFDVDKELYYFSVSVKNMYGGTKKCAAILEVFGNDKKITDYVFINGLRCNKKEEAIKLVNFYNSY